MLPDIECLHAAPLLRLMLYALQLHDAEMEPSAPGEVAMEALPTDSVRYFVLSVQSSAAAMQSLRALALLNC